MESNLPQTQMQIGTNLFCVVFHLVGDLFFACSLCFLFCFGFYQEPTQTRRAGIVRPPKKEVIEKSEEASGGAS